MKYLDSKVDDEIIEVEIIVVMWYMMCGVRVGGAMVGRWWVEVGGVKRRMGSR